MRKEKREESEGLSSILKVVIVFPAFVLNDFGLDAKVTLQETKQYLFSFYHYMLNETNLLLNELNNKIMKEIP